MEINTQELQKIYLEQENITHSAKIYAERHGIDFSDSFRRRCSKVLNSVGAVSNDLDNTTETNSNNYTNDKEKPQRGFTAIGEDGQLMSIEKYCEFYGLDVNKIRSYKLISHTGLPFYNCVFYEEVIEPAVTEQELKELILRGFEGINYSPITKYTKNKIGVVKIADLHLGAYVDNLIRTKNFSIDILANKLSEAVNDINERNYSVVHVHILGDLIESFTGLSHKNTWKGLDKAMVGAEAVKLVVKILHDNFLSKIVNLGEIKVVAGNHDRVTSDNKEDVQGGAASLVCWGLELLGYDVEFNSLVITHTIGKITHILTHGHHALSKKSTKQLCWDYGVQGNYNLICEGHLHSIIQKLNINQRDTYQTIKDDAVDHRRMNCPSFFTGNFFSESLGYTSESGFVITEDNGKGVPNVFYYAI
jgi:predicted phosphodiesterase